MKPHSYYNEFDPNAAAWLRQLIAEGLIPPGEVDQRSITDVRPTDLSGYTQCHFFCGIGGWSLALALAGWPAGRPVWTGSCPCQPFSVAGKGKGNDDERHLWPAFFNLIRECRPDTVFGEQVSSAIGHGWLDGIQSDLEGEKYAVGHCVLGAHSVGANHQRQRLYWVADATSSAGPQHEREQGGGPWREAGPADGSERRSYHGGMADSIRPGLEGYRWHGDHGHESRWNGTDPIGSTAPCCSACGRVGDSTMQQRERLWERAEVNGRTGETGGSSSGCGGLGESDSDGRKAGVIAGATSRHWSSAESTSVPGGVDDAERERCAARGDGDNGRNERQQLGAAGEICRMAYASLCAGQPSESRAAFWPIQEGDGASLSCDPWSDSVWIFCRDSKYRRIPTQSILQFVADGLPSVMGNVGLEGFTEDEVRAIGVASYAFPLAEKIPFRPQLLKGAGNAIVPQVAAAFITAFLQSNNQS